MFKKNFLALYILLTGVNLSAQEKAKIDLPSLIQKGLNRNPNTKVYQIEVQKHVENIILAKHQFLPNLNGQFANSTTNGRFIDPYTNEFSTQSNYYNNLSLNSQWQLFTGGRSFFNLSVYKKAKEKSEKELNLVKTQIKKQIAISYFTLKILFESKKNVINKIELNQQLVGYSSLMMEAGRFSISDSLEITNQLMALNIEASTINNLIVEEINNIKLITGTDSLDIESISFQDHTVLEPDTNHSSINNLPEILIAESNLYIAKKNISIQKTALSPQLSLNTSIYTGYSEGNKITNQNTGEIETSSFKDQMDDNLYTGITLNLYIPIYNKRTYRTQINKAEIQCKINEINLQNSILKTQLEFQKQKLKLETYFSNHLASLKRAKNQQIIFDLYYKKYKSGKINTFNFIKIEQALLDIQIEAVKNTNTFLLNQFLFTNQFLIN